MSETLIAEIIAILLGLGITFLGVRYQKLKGFLKKIVDAAEDDKFTAEEVQNIIKAFKDLF